MTSFKDSEQIRKVEQLRTRTSNSIPKELMDLQVGVAIVLDAAQKAAAESINVSPINGSIFKGNVAIAGDQLQSKEFQVLLNELAVEIFDKKKSGGKVNKSDIAEPIAKQIKDHIARQVEPRTTEQQIEINGIKEIIAEQQSKVRSIDGRATGNDVHRTETGDTVDIVSDKQKEVAAQEIADKIAGQMVSALPDRKTWSHSR